MLKSTKFQHIAKFQKSDLFISIRQLLITLIPYFTIWYLMWLLLPISYLLTLLLSVLGAGFMVRIFIIFHDCTHGAFFKSQSANNWLGRVLGVLLFTPYRAWQHEHAEHHATASDLDHRGVGDIWTMTVNEYKQASKWTRFVYRLFRNPIVLFGVGPTWLFLVRNRLYNSTMYRREKVSTILTNIAILWWVLLLSVVLGFKNYLLIQLPILAIASSLGVWLFYVQHQFEGVYWDRAETWDYTKSALDGSSFYKLPRWLQWFTGSIGFHHVHHLSPKIPNYYLEQCHEANPELKKIKPITFWMSLKVMSFKLWDEDRKCLVGFDAVKD